MTDTSTSYLKTLCEEVGETFHPSLTKANASKMITELRKRPAPHPIQRPMKTWIALLRGVNVGGNGSLPMKGLRDLLEELGHTNVATYIQSGNCVFQSKSADAAKISEGIAAAINNAFGFKPAVITLSLKDLDAALEDNPFPQGAGDLKSVHVFFLREAADKADMASLKALCEGDEAVQLIGKRLYTYTPAGIGRSKMAGKIGKFVPVEMTARNLRSVGKIAELARSLGKNH